MTNQLKLIETQIRGCIPYEASILTSERVDKGINIMGLPYVNLHMIQILEFSGKQWCVKSDATTDRVHLEIFNDDTAHKNEYVIVENGEQPSVKPVNAMGMSFTMEEYVVNQLTKTGAMASIGNNLTITRSMFDDFLIKHNTSRSTSSEKLPAISNCVIQGHKLIVTRPRKTTSKQPLNRLLKRRAQFSVCKKRIDHARLRKRLNVMRATRKASKARSAPSDVPI